MNIDQQDQLSMLISQTWRNSPPPHIWAEELTNLNHNQAEAAYRKLRAEAENTPSIARYLATYRSLNQTVGRDLNDCPDCGGDGFQTITEHRNGQAYPDTFKACGCKAGNNAQRVINDTNAHNDRLHGHGTKDTTA